MNTGGNIVAFKTPFGAYEHCQKELAVWHPQWRTALENGDIDELHRLLERHRHRIIAVFPRADYPGAWSSALRGFAYRLYEFSEFDEPLKHITEARASYEQCMSDLAPDSLKATKAPQIHSYAELLLRYCEISGDTAQLPEAAALCRQATAVWDGERRRHEATLGAVLRRIAEGTRDHKDCDAALEALSEASADQDPSNGDLSWALQRRSLGAVLLLKHRISSNREVLSTALAAVQSAIENYEINPHKVWIRPSSLADARGTKASIEAALQG